MACVEHLDGKGAASTAEKVSALRRQLEDLRSENERLASENGSLEDISDLERQVQNLRAENERLASANESLRAESTAHSAKEASTPSTAAWKEGSDYLAQELNRIHDVASELGLTLLEPIKHNELSILCSLISHEFKLANLKRFLQEYSGVSDTAIGSVCLAQTGRGRPPLWLSISEATRTSCYAHGDNSEDCVFITKRGSRWIISGDLI